jgi:hypothetical protein
MKWKRVALNKLASAKALNQPRGGCTTTTRNFIVAHFEGFWYTKVAKTKNQPEKLFSGSSPFSASRRVSSHLWAFGSRHSFRKQRAAFDSQLTDIGTDGTG